MRFNTRCVTLTATFQAPPRLRSIRLPRYRTHTTSTAENTPVVVTYWKVRRNLTEPWILRHSPLLVVPREAPLRYDQTISPRTTIAVRSAMALPLD